VVYQGKIQVDITQVVCRNLQVNLTHIHRLWLHKIESALHATTVNPYLKDGVIPVQKDTFQVGMLRNDFVHKLWNLVQLGNIEDLGRNHSFVLFRKLVQLLLSASHSNNMCSRLSIFACKRMANSLVSTGHIVVVPDVAPTRSTFLYGADILEQLVRQGSGLSKMQRRGE